MSNRCEVKLERLVSHQGLPVNVELGFGSGLSDSEACVPCDFPK